MLEEGLVESQQLSWFKAKNAKQLIPEGSQILKRDRIFSGGWEYGVDNYFRPDWVEDNHQTEFAMLHYQDNRR